ncbi:hypothetical protein [Alteribacter populi]|uniref:hypothetical protein n=1 Tax=Alteribacter populi TaxID=2011011 RepID=UPI000BBA4132|nr:hypothetical protein [Alteribacter populi]
MNKARKHVTVDSGNVEGYVSKADELSKCQDVLLSTMGFAYAYALKMIINGFTDADDDIYSLFIAVKLTEFTEIKRLLTLKSGDTPELGVTVTVQE